MKISSTLHTISIFVKVCRIRYMKSKRNEIDNQDNVKYKVTLLQFLSSMFYHQRKH